MRARAAALAGLLLCACGGGGGTTLVPPGADLAGLRVVRIQVDAHPLEVWVAETPAQQAQGLMQASPAQLAPTPDGTPRGMLFVFPAEDFVAFTMRDTWVPLDLAHFAADGRLLEVHALTPLEETPVPSTQAVRYSLEVPAGTLAVRGIAAGSRLGLPLP